MPNIRFKVMAPRSRVTPFIDWASQAPQNFLIGNFLMFPINDNKGMNLNISRGEISTVGHVSSHDLKTLCSIRCSKGKDLSGLHWEPRFSCQWVEENTWYLWCSPWALGKHTNIGFFETLLIQQSYFLVLGKKHFFSTLQNSFGCS